MEGECNGAHKFLAWLEGKNHELAEGSTANNTTGKCSKLVTTAILMHVFIPQQQEGEDL
jgi:hypothetical protein